MGYKLYCKRCNHNYWTCGSGTWYTSGTVTRCPSYGYCGSCAGEYNPSRSWSGNVVKVECGGCSNLITVITWSDWESSSYEDVGYCSGCHDNWVNKKSSWNSLKSSASNCSWARVAWDGWSGYSSLCSSSFRIHCGSNHYVYNGSAHHVIKWILNKSSCPVCDDSNWYPENANISNPSWGKVQCSTDNWRQITSCSIKCNKHNHCVYNGTRYSDIKSVLAWNHCQQCEQRPDWCPSNYVYNFASWSRTDYSVVDNFWVRCNIWCNNVSHLIYNGTTHSQITSKCTLTQCPECKQETDRYEQLKRDREIQEENERKEKEKVRLNEQKKTADAVKKKCGEYSKKCDDIIDALNKNNFDEKKEELLINANDMSSLENMINDGVQKINGALSAITVAIADCQHLSDEEKKTATYETEEELNKTLEKIDKAQQMLLKYKKELREHNKQLREEEMKSIDEENKHNKKQKKLIQENQTLDDTQVKIDELRKELKNLSGDEVNAAPGSIGIMNKKFNQLIKELNMKYTQNKAAKKELKESKGRLRKIKGKMKAAKSQNKYMMQLLDKEYDLLDRIADDAQEKYDNNSTYFLTITMGLDEKITELFIDAGYDLEDIKDIKNEEPLTDIGIDDEELRKNILKNIEKNQQKK